MNARKTPDQPNSGQPLAEQPSPGELSPRSREQTLQRLGQQHYDIVVVGGGVTGCGIALDAATRGLSVALVEMRDYASGTSSRSGKLIHGGLRYLEQLNFSLVKEALTERALMLRTLCPHLVRPVRFIYPLEHRVWERFYLGSGLVLYDTMGGAGAVPRHRHLTKRGALRLAPALKPEELVGALTFYDAAIDDARHTMTLARTAAAYGADVASGTKVTGFLREGQRVTGVKVHDAISDREIPVVGKQVINAAGVWTDQIQDMVGGRGKFQVRASKGVHILVPRDRIHSDAAILVRAEDSVVFIRPWGRHWLIGTTDTKWELDLDHPAANRDDIDYLLRQVNRVISPELSREDVEGVYAGLRPLLAGESATTSRLSREHAVESPVPGLTVIAGGKYTTYRVMAKDAVDAAARGLDGAAPESCTQNIPLLGAAGYQALWNSRQRLADEYGLHVARIEHLLQRYGSLVTEVLALVKDRPDLGEPLEGAEEYLRVEISYAASHEGALFLDDALTRRTHVSFETMDRGLTAAAPAAALMAEVLGWDDATTKAQIEHYQQRIEAERASQEEMDDAGADAVRKKVRDSRL
ncbi:glycerol-3-phosphate dehydrogenase/oxidase [Pseudonocardia sp.]|uniref:glycerol-3-phosphate dehydrogenase/oxidase n=1 Tax=Pseudonocardia sp. TaxID=60912 RepID=UPI0039C8C129